MKREEAEKLKDEIAETQDMFRRAEHLKIENDIHRLENELNAARTMDDQAVAAKRLQEERDKAPAEHAKIDGDRDAATKSQQDFIERQVIPEADRGMDESRATAVHENKEMAHEQLEAARHVQEQLQQQALEHEQGLQSRKHERQGQEDDRRPEHDEERER